MGENNTPTALKGCGGKNGQNLTFEETSHLDIEDQGHKTIAFVALPIYTHIPKLKGLTKTFFKLSRPKGNLCSGDGGGMAVLHPKHPRLSSGDTIKIRL